MRQKDKDSETTDEEITQVISDLYLPSWTEKNAPTQPLATALPLDIGKNLCLQNFIQRCRTMRLRLPAEQQAEVPALAIEKLAIEWNLTDDGIFQGRPKTSLPQPLASITHIMYLLQPVR
ncbi:MAG TPA: hypothetical protein VKU00_00535 [Chthonomonadaceae bacterium]|nr:hypothetical protein [Chthonomonadaceae bacterium]